MAKDRTEQQEDQTIVSAGDDGQTPADGGGAPSPALDYEEALYQQALAEAEAEEAGQKQEPQGAEPTAEPQPSPAPAAAPTGEPGATPPAPQPVPYAVFAERNRALREAEDRVAYLEGALEALRQPGPAQPTAPAAPAQPGRVETADQINTQITSLEAQLEALAGEYEMGKISPTDWSKKHAAITRQIAGLEAKATIAAAEVGRATQPPAQAAAQSLADELLIERNAQRLKADNPCIGLIESIPDPDAAHAHLQALAQMAHTAARAAGHPIGKGPRETLRLHAVMAQLSETYVRTVFPNVPIPARPATTPPSPQTQPQPGRLATLPALSAQRAGKAALAATMPPNPGDMGRVAPSNGEPTDADIEAMDADTLMTVLDKFPALRQRYLEGIT